MSSFINDVGTLSGSTDFQISASYVIVQSLKLINQLDPKDDYPTPAQASDGLITLNLLLKHMEGQGLQTWLRSQQSVPLVNGKRNYTLGPTGDVVIPRPIKVLEAFSRITASSTDVMLVRTSEKTYYDISDKGTAGVPTQFTYFNTLTDTSITVWPVPDATVASTYTVELIYAKPFDDIDVMNQTLEVLPGMLDAVIYQLAVRLAPKYKLPLDERAVLIQEAALILDQSNQAAKEEGSILVQPDVGYQEGHL